jgi:hypothetical protein
MSEVTNLTVFRGIKLNSETQGLTTEVVFRGVKLVADNQDPAGTVVFRGIKLREYTPAPVNTVVFRGIRLDSDDGYATVRYDFTFNVIGKTVTYYDFTFDVYPRIATYYDFVFNVTEKVAESYPFEFNILKESSKYDFSFDVLPSTQFRTSYEFSYNVVSTTQNKTSHDFWFYVQQPRTLYDFEFSVTEATMYYGFEFYVAAPKKILYDFTYDVIEEWVPVTLVCTAVAVSPGTILSSANKHRLNFRVYAGTTLVGAGTANYIWNGTGGAKVKFVIDKIPQLSGAQRFMVFDNSVKKYDYVNPGFAERWEGSYAEA